MLFYFSECINDRTEMGLPIQERACIISQDCAVSEWSEWKVIQEGCIDPNGNVSSVYQQVAGILFL